MLFRSLAGVFGLNVDNNPVLKSISLLSALESGFDSFEDILSDPGNFASFKKTGPSLQDQAGNNAENVKKLLKKAFEPEGIFSKIKSLLGVSRMPFVDSEDIFLQELMTAPAKSVLLLRQAVLSGFTSKNVQDNVQDFVADEAPGVLMEPRKILPASGQPVTSTGQLISLVSTATSGGGDKASATITAKAKDDPNQFLNGFIDSISSQTKVKKDTVTKVLNALVAYNNSKKGGKKGGKKPAASPAPAQESKMYITVDDVFDAKIKLFECNTSEEWVDLLFEQKGSVQNPELKAFLSKIGKVPSERANKISKDSFDKLVAELDAIQADDSEKEIVRDRMRTKFPNVDTTSGGSKSLPGKGITNVVSDIIKANQNVEKQLGQSESIFNQIEADPIKHKQVAAVLKKNLQDLLTFIDSTGDVTLTQQISDWRSRYDEIKGKETPQLVVIYSILQALNSKVAAWYKTLSEKSESEKRQILTQLAKREAELSRSIQDEKSRNAQLKDELARLAAQGSEKDKAYDRLLKSSAGIIRKFVQELADELGEDPAKLQDEISDAGGIKKYIDAIKEKNAAEIAKAAAEAGVPGLPAGGAPSPAAPSSSKKDKAAESIKADLKNIKTDTIKKVLDALPDWMISEVSRHRAALLFEIKRTNLIQ